MALKPIDTRTALGFVEEAQTASRDWRAESWRDQEMYDGAQWSARDRENAVDQGLDPLVINRTFPAVNLVLGSQAVNRLDIVAKARTHKDGQMAEIMSEGIQFVLDQNQGQFLISEAFRNATIPGIGWLYVGLNPDPRKERIKLDTRDWKEIWWDPFASPWLDPDKCRYVFHQRWMDLEELIGWFPEQEKAIRETYRGLNHQDAEYLGSIYGDEADNVEQLKRVLGSTRWTDPERKRVRPVELWYPVMEKGLFALMPDGQCIEIRRDCDPALIYQLVHQASEVVSAQVRKMRVMTFLGRQVLQHMASPFGHDEYPFVPFIGYLDRFQFPFGLPRQIRGQDEEVNKRRAMALAQLQRRRIIIEEGAADDLQTVYDEVNSMDGMVVLKEGGIAKAQILEGRDLAPAQMDLLYASEREIQQVSGANDESLGYKSNATSGRALEQRQRQGATVLASVFDNQRRSLNRLGTLVSAEIQDKWKGPKVLRITDRITNQERFVEVNETVPRGDGGFEVRNDITQGRYDIVISDAPQSDTVREKNLDLIIEWIKQSPPEVIPHLMSLALELSNLPNKDNLLMRLRPLLGGMPGEEDMTPEELRQALMERMESEKAEAQAMAELKQRMEALEIQAKELENDKLRAEILATKAKARSEMRKAGREDFQVQHKAEVDRSRAEREALQARQKAETEQRKAEASAAQGVMRI
ncbi:hypothetical protein [Pseudodesulfovibrio tunisiensis]|uniref:portal protein n=1 Tax=Pseudodesulfovibrio tunisiensis TaxID=463192 RepID=UPI001FB2F9B2|nr:hypothetical protein [Pseudodesulfovibrio tunisiensis]